MYRRFVALLFVFACAGTLFAQDLSNIQIHGFATQGFLYSSTNNYLSTNSSSGSLGWTDGAVSVSDALSDKLRVGIQLHMYQLGEFGGPNIQVDWAAGDYKVNDHLGFRAGKIKTPVGLFNDSQDVDAVHLWALLPQSIYPTDNKSFTLSHLGGEVYGSQRLGKRTGTLVYRGYAGYRPMDLNGGYTKTLDLSLTPIEQAFGLPQTLITTAPSGKDFGGDVRWQTPLKGLLIGSSAIVMDLHGVAGAVSFRAARNTDTTEYAQFERGKFFAAFELRRMPIEFIITPTTPMGPMSIPASIDWRSWYGMTSYRLTEKLQVGTYYSHLVSAGQGINTSLSENYSKDWTVSARYDFNSYFYGKLEEHFVHGTNQSYYADSNPDGLKPRSNILAAKVGFSF
jgi:hypothetical protein